MRKQIFYSVLFVSILITSSIVIATPREIPPGQLKEKNAPGQWKKSSELTFANQKEFVYMVHMRIWERMQSRHQEYLAMGIEKSVPNPLGLLKLLNLLTIQSELEEEDEELELEPGPDEEEPEEEEEEPEEEPEEEEEEPEEEPEEEEEEP